MFNAGRGYVLNEQGEHELDASIMDGSNLACGGFWVKRRTAKVARHVMTDTRHVFLQSVGRINSPRVSDWVSAAEYFITDERHACLEEVASS